jgi:UDP-GlcNAc3NAcA epimerase
MFDTTLSIVDTARSRSRILVDLGLAPKGYAVATLHRAENTDDPDRFDRLVSWLEQAACTQPIVMPIHPRTRKLLDERKMLIQGVRMVDPLGYLDMAWLAHNATAIFTDSGGLQKEAYFHRVPCVTLRDETEWVETIEAGWNRLWTTDQYAPERRHIADYGDGTTSQKIAAILAAALG